MRELRLSRLMGSPHRLAVLLLLGLSITSFQTAAAASFFDRIKNMLGGSSDAANVLSAADINGGLKEALRVGTQRVVENLGQPDGFNLDPDIHIGLPAELNQVKNVLARVGMDSAFTDLEVRLNRAAEIATPKAQRLFIDAIGAMTLEDAQGIYEGADDAATQFFKAKMSAPLAEQMLPVVDESLADAGVVQVYKTVMDRYASIPFVPQVDANLSQYVVDKGVNGIFHYLAIEEAAIREDPAKRTTELLQKVFTQGN